ncbi:MAG: hypothetical protein MRECE_2c004 [Mycoplasmataceae bacterium CE_OT135]|nr:MAG: hypothetical protein MRECE_2c004 [Mycoplasmataceae bacterium CE_OT135]
MPICQPTPNFTNQQLLTELDKRIKEGTIAFKQSEPAPSLISGLSPKIILLFALVALALFYFATRSTVTQTEVQIFDNSPQSPVCFA